MNNLSAEEVVEKVIFIQKQWSNSIIEIGKAYKEKKNYLELTNKFLDKLYFFDKGKVLFKPTKASQKPFRKSKSACLSLGVISSDSDL